MIVANLPHSTRPAPIVKSAPVSELCVSAFSSPNLDALDAASTISPLSATLTKNTGGGGISQASPRNSNHNPSPFNLKLLSLFTLSLEGSLEGSVVEGSTFNCFSPISFRIRTYAKPARNPFTMNTSKTQDLKLFRMNTYEKRGVGVLVAQASACARRPRSILYPERRGTCPLRRATAALLTTHFPLLTAFSYYPPMSVNS